MMPYGPMSYGGPQVMSPPMISGGYYPAAPHPAMLGSSYIASDYGYPAQYASYDQPAYGYPYGAPIESRTIWPETIEGRYSSSPKGKKSTTPKARRAQTPKPEWSTHPAAYQSSPYDPYPAWSSSPTLADPRESFFDRLSRPVYRTFPTADGYGYEEVEHRPTLHQSIKDREETIERLLRPKNVVLQAAPIVKTPKGQKSTTKNPLPPGMEETLVNSTVGTSKGIVQIRDIYDESKRLAKEATKLREEPTIHHRDMNFSKPISHATTCLVSPNLSAVLDEPVQQPNKTRLDETHRKETHDRLYKDAIETAAKKKVMEENLRSPTGKKLSSKEVKDTITRLVAPIPPPRPYDEGPARKIVPYSEREKITERLTKTKPVAPPPLPHEMRTKYPKHDDDRIEQGLERLTKQPARYEEFAKKQQALMQKQQGPNHATGTGVARISGAFISS